MASLSLFEDRNQGIGLVGIIKSPLSPPALNCMAQANLISSVAKAASWLVLGWENSMFLKQRQAVINHLWSLTLKEWSL